MAKPIKVYWDTCVWLRLIKGETYHDRCEYIVERARKGEVEIWTSVLTLAEAYRKNCGDDQHVRLPAAKDVELLDFVNQAFVKLVQVDLELASLARQLCRDHARLKKANDGIHLASAILYNADEMHTTDRSDLLRLDPVTRKDGLPLPISEPPEIPPAPADEQPPGPDQFELEPSPRK